MTNIQFDDGMQGYQINNGGILRFNPADPNIYTRFLQLDQKLEQLQKELSGLSDSSQQLAEADLRLKQLLGWVFGQHNDFDALLGGVSLLAVAGNGQRVLTNFLQALEPILQQGADQCVQELTQAAVEQATMRRASQC